MNFNPGWGSKRGRNHGPRGRGRGWRGNPHQGGNHFPRGGPHGLRGGPRGGGGFRGPPLENFRQPFSPNLNPNDPPWGRIRNRPPFQPNLSQRRPLLSPPRSHLSPPRPTSPLPGTEEYMQRDISEKSAFLKRELELEAPEFVINSTKYDITNTNFASDTVTENFFDTPARFRAIPPTESVQIENKPVQQIMTEKAPSPRRNKRSTQRQTQERVLGVEEIHDKIMNHISNLSLGKKINIVNQPRTTGYDIAIQQITRQKRLELSKALRDMCNNKFKETEDSSEVINAIIPDFDIKIEELPRELVEQLSSTLNEDIEERIQNFCVDPEAMFQQAAAMLNSTLEGDLKTNNIANETVLDDVGDNYSEFQSKSDDTALDVDISQNIEECAIHYNVNDVQAQPGLPFNEMAPLANIRDFPTQCQTSSIDFSVPPPMNFSVPPPAMNFTLPPPLPTLPDCQPQNSQVMQFPTEFSNTQMDNTNTFQDPSNSKAIESSELFPGGNSDGLQYYSPGHESLDSNCYQATPVFNDLMMEQNVVKDNGTKQTDLPLPAEVNNVLTNPCDNPQFNLTEDQESGQYFNMNTKVDEILLPPTEPPHDLVPEQNQLPGNLPEQTDKQYFQPNVIDDLLLPPVLEIKSETKEKIDMNVPLLSPKNENTGSVSDVLIEAAELEACLAQSDRDLKLLDLNSKSIKVSFTLNKTNRTIETDNVLETDSKTLKLLESTKKLKLRRSPIRNKETVAETLTDKSESKKESKNTENKLRKKEPVKKKSESEKKTSTSQKPIKSCKAITEESKSVVNTIAEQKNTDICDKLKDDSQKEIVSVERTEEIVTADLDSKDMSETNEKEKCLQKFLSNTSGIKEKVPDISIIGSVEIEKESRNKEKFVESQTKKTKSRSRSIEQEVFSETKTEEKKLGHKEKTKQYVFDEEEAIERRRDQKAKSKYADTEELSKTERHNKSRFERSRYDIFQTEKCEEEYRKKYKEKFANEDERYRKSDKDRSFEKYRDKHRSPDSEQSETYRYSKYHSEREETRHSKRYYHEKSTYPYRTEYDYSYGAQKYTYSPEFYSRQEAPYLPAEYEKSHCSRSKHEKSHKKRSKKHKRHREESFSSSSSDFSSDKESSTSSQKKSKNRSKCSDLPDSSEERIPSRTLKKPLKERIQVLYESKNINTERDASSDYDENRKIKSEPVSPEISKQLSPERRAKSIDRCMAEKVSSQPVTEKFKNVESVVADSEIPPPTNRLQCPPTPVVPFTNKPCPGRTQIENPEKEREEMIMNTSKISFRDKPCTLSTKPVTPDDLEKQNKLEMAKKLPDMDNIAKIISNLSTIVQTKEDSKQNVETISDKQTLQVVDEMQTQDITKKPNQRLWKSPGEKKFMMEHLSRNPPFEEEELDYEISDPDQIKMSEIHFSEEAINETDNQKASRSESPHNEKLSYLNPEPDILVPLPGEKLIEEKLEIKNDFQELTTDVNSAVMGKDCLSVENLQCGETQNDNVNVQDNPINIITDQNELKPSADVTSVEVNSTSVVENSKNTTVEQSESLKSSTSAKLEDIEKPEEKPEKESKSHKARSNSKNRKHSKNTNKSSRSKSRSRSNPKEVEILHSAEVSSTSDASTKSNPKLPISETTSKLKSELKDLTVANDAKPETIKTTEIKCETNDNVKSSRSTDERMFVTTYTQTNDSHDKKDSHKKSKKDTKKTKHRSVSPKSEKIKSKNMTNTYSQTSVSNVSISTQTPNIKCKHIHIQCNLDEKSTSKESTLVQTDPIVIINTEDEIDTTDKPEDVDKSSRKILKAVRRRNTIQRMFDLDREIEKLTKFRQSLYKKLNFDSDLDESDSEIKVFIKAEEGSATDDQTNMNAEKHKRKLNTDKKQADKQSESMEKTSTIRNVQCTESTHAKVSRRNQLPTDNSEIASTSRKSSKERMERSKSHKQKLDMSTNSENQNTDKTSKSTNIEKINSSKDDNVKDNEAEVKSRSIINGENLKISEDVLLEKKELVDIKSEAKLKISETHSTDERKGDHQQISKNSDVTDSSNINKVAENDSESKIKTRSPSVGKQDHEERESPNYELANSSTRNKQKGLSKTKLLSTSEDMKKTRRKSRREAGGSSERDTSTELIPSSSSEHRTQNTRKRRHKKSDIIESKREDSSGRDTSTEHKEYEKKSDLENTKNENKSKKKSKHSKSSRKSKEKNILKIKIKTPNLQMKLEESRGSESPPLKRRRKTPTELSDVNPKQESEELLKTIDDAIKNETDTITQSENNMEAITLSKSHKKIKDCSKTNKSKSKRVKDTPHSKEFEEATIPEGANTSEEKDGSGVQTSQETSRQDNSLLLGFKRLSKSNQEIWSTSEVPDKIETAKISDDVLNESVKEESQFQKPKKRKKTDVIELDPEIDSQNLLLVKSSKKIKSLTEYPDGDHGSTHKKKRRYPFSKVNSNYRSRKRKSSTDTAHKSSNSKRKSPVDVSCDNSINSTVNDGKVHVTRYSLLQLEEMRNNIRNKKISISDCTAEVTDDFDCISRNIEKTEPHMENEAFLDGVLNRVEESSTDCEIKVDSAMTIPTEICSKPEENATEPPTESNSEAILEESRIDEEMISNENIDDVPSTSKNDANIDALLHLETSNEMFEDFVKESMTECEDEPPILIPECDEVSESKEIDCEVLEILDEDDDYRMDFKGFSGAILVIKVIASTALAASDKGKVFSFNMLNGDLTNTFEMSNVPITSMVIIKRNEANLLYTGSLDCSLGILNFDTKEILKHKMLVEPVQCMEHAWNYIFIGSDRGSLIRFDLNTEEVAEEIKISDFNVLMIRATQEGPRRVLVIATRNAPVCIRDAWSGLLLRTMETPFSPTVYTLLFDKNLIYCGTSQHDILVYTFEDGQLIFKHEATKSKGVVCMQIVGNLLFAGCYNGNIYVYNTKTNIHLGTMNGPGGLMLSMGIVRNKIIVGTKSSNFRAWRIPQKYLDQI